MIPYLFSFGRFHFNLYGFFIALGTAAFLWAANRDWLTRVYLKPGQLSNIVIVGVILGIVGGRILSLITDWSLYSSLYEMVAPWEPGYSLQGSVIALSIGIPIYLHVKKIYIPAVFDIAGLYAPLLQSIARIGCFCAGCCSGSPTSVSWAVTYTHQESYAPLFQAIHPSQLYSSLGLFLLFVFMHAVARKITHKPGQLFGIYLMGASLERFINDFWRGEHVPTAHSPEQLLALCLFGVGLVLLWWATVAPTKPYHKP